MKGREERGEVNTAASSLMSSRVFLATQMRLLHDSNSSIISVARQGSYILNRKIK